LKFIFLLIMAAAIIIGIVSLAYKPAYAVTLNNEFIGYTTNKSKLQNRINEYMKKGDGENIAFVDIEILPEYSFCFLKRSTITNDDAILKDVKELGTTYYEYYAITVDNEEKNYTKTKTEAEAIIDELKEQKSDNISKVGYIRVHDTELKEFSDTETVVSALYVKPKPVVRTTSDYGLTYVALSDTSNKPDLGMSFSSPVSGVITSRYGYRGGERHTGLDIGAGTGTPIRAVAAGTVVYSGNAGNGYGNYIRISHGNGVETLYAHCSALYVTAGQWVEQGENIAAVGSTGRSSGPHLHIEIRVNGESLNPELYVY